MTNPPKLTYETGDDGKVRFVIAGGNGEVQARSEWYDNDSNARRGARDLAVSVIQLIDIETGEND